MRKTRKRYRSRPHLREMRRFKKFGSRLVLRLDELVNFSRACPYVPVTLLASRLHLTRSIMQRFERFGVLPPRRRHDRCFAYHPGELLIFVMRAFAFTVDGVADSTIRDDRVLPGVARECIELTKICEIFMAMKPVRRSKIARQRVLAMFVGYVIAPTIKSDYILNAAIRESLPSMADQMTSAEIAKRALLNKSA